MQSLGGNARDISHFRGRDIRNYSVGDFVAVLNQDLSCFYDWYRGGRQLNETRLSDTGEPEGCAISLADVVIGIAEYCNAHGIDIEEAIRQKMAYNAEQPLKSPYRCPAKPS